jgi:hypothetical protein
MCFSKGTIVRLFNGGLKKIEDIVIGDLLMGDDSNPRKVLSLYEGMGNLFRIKQSRGCDYYIDEQQMLSLEKQDEGSIIWDQKKIAYRVDWSENHQPRMQFFFVRDMRLPATETQKLEDDDDDDNMEALKLIALKNATHFLDAIKTKSTYSMKGSTIDLSLSDYLSRSDIWKSKYFAYKANIEYPEAEIFIDPYILGLWLAGDNQSGSVLTLPQINPKLFGYLTKFAMANELKLSNSHENPNSFQLTKIDSLEIIIPIKTKNKSKTQDKPEKVRNIFKMALKAYHLLEQKHIPSSYLINSREIRLKLLAGFLDRSATFNQALLCYELNLKSDLLADQIIQLCHSLGWYCKKHLNLVELCYKILISGTTLADVPVLLERTKIDHKIKHRLPQTTELTSKLIVDKWDNGYYYGFELDNNGKFVLPDYTVVHN